jgi:hypothetical protein
MKNLFLIRLFNQYKLAGSLVFVYALTSAWLFTKKMDWVLIPRNDMFSGQPTDTVYFIPRLYINDTPVLTSGMLYWKRDFLEQSIRLYVKAKKHGTLYQADWLNRHEPTFPWLRLMENGINPDESKVEWYAKIAGINVQGNDRIEIRVDTIRLKNNHLYNQVKP